MPKQSKLPPAPLDSKTHKLETALDTDSTKVRLPVVNKTNSNTGRKAERDARRLAREARRATKKESAISNDHPNSSSSALIPATSLSCIVAITHHDDRRLFHIKDKALELGLPCLILQWQAVNKFLVRETDETLSILKGNTFTSASDLADELVKRRINHKITAFIEANLGNVGGASMTEAAHDFTHHISANSVMFFSATSSCLSDTQKYCNREHTKFSLPTTVKEFVISDNLFLARRLLLKAKGWTKAPEALTVTLASAISPPKTSVDPTSEIGKIITPSSVFIARPVTVRKTSQDESNIKTVVSSETPTPSAVITRKRSWFEFFCCLPKAIPVAVSHPQIQEEKALKKPSI